MAAKRGPKGPMTDEHKAALAKGRSEGRAVRDYLEALRANKPKRGRKRTPDSIRSGSTSIDDELEDADAVTELRLVQERRDLTSELDIDGRRRRHRRRSRRPSSRSPPATATARASRTSPWREIGVPAAVLKRAGISRSS